MLNKKLPLFLILLFPLTLAAQSPAAYTGGSTFNNGFARLVKDSAHYFYIDTSGQYVFDEVIKEDYPAYSGGFSRDTDRPIDTAKESLPREIVKVRKNGRIGVLTAYGKWMLEPVYDTIETQWDFAWKATKDHKVSFFARQGWLLPFRFDSIGYLDGNYFDVHDNGKWGVYSSKEDKMVIPAEYEAFDYCGGCGYKGDYVFAQRNGKWGIVNFKNEVLLPFEYEHEHFNMRSDEWVESLSKDGRHLVINLNTGFVDSTGNFDPEFADTSLRSLLPAPYVATYKGDNAGVSDSSGKVIIPPVYDWAIQLGYGKQLFSNTHNDTTILFDLSGKRVLKADALDLEELGIGGFAADSNTIYIAKFKKKGLYGFYNPYGKKMIPARYTKLEGNYSNHYLEVSMGLKAGAIDTAGKVIVPLVYDAVRTTFVPNMIQVQRNDKVGVYSIKQHIEIIPAIYDDISFWGDVSLISLTKGDRMGFADMDGKIFCPPAYSNAQHINSKWMVLEKSINDTQRIYSVMDVATRKITPLPYTSVSPAGLDALLIVGKGIRQYLYDLDTGKEIAGDYTENGGPVFISSFENGLAQVVTDNGCGYMNPQGHMMMPATYALVSPMQDGLGLVVNKPDSSGRSFYGYVDSSGRMIVPMEYDYRDNSYGHDYFKDSLLMLYRAQADDQEVLVGCATLDGRIIAPPVYQGLKRIPEKGFLVRKDGKFGMLTLDGAILMPPVYDDMALDKEFLSGYNDAAFRFPLLCKENGTWRYFGSDGKPLPATVKEVVDFYVEIIDEAATPAAMPEAP